MIYHERSYSEFMLLAMIGELFVENKIKQEQIEMLQERLPDEDTPIDLASHERRGRNQGSDSS